MLILAESVDKDFYTASHFNGHLVVLAYKNPVALLLNDGRVFKRTVIEQAAAPTIRLDGSISNKIDQAIESLKSNRPAIKWRPTDTVDKYTWASIEKEADSSTLNGSLPLEFIGVPPRTKIVQP